MKQYDHAINVKSEIAPLQKVLLHRPGDELLNLTPNTLERLLFDDIPFLLDAQREHDNFAKILRSGRIEVVYLEDLMAEVLAQSSEVESQFIDQFLHEAGIRTAKYHKLLFDYLKSFTDKKALVLKTMSGIKVNEISRAAILQSPTLADFIKENTEFLTEPMPNLYFTRDPFACAGNGVILNKMYSATRSRETIYGEYIFGYHPDFKDQVRLFYDRQFPYHIEGGDVLNLNAETLAVGISQRTEARAIDQLARNIFSLPDCPIKTILAIDIPESRAFMHLDTVFTQVDYDKFTVHPDIYGTLRAFEITAGDFPSEFEDLNVKEIRAPLQAILEKYIGRPVTLIPCAGGDKIAAQREQWNDGTNTLCLAPGVVVVYDRNNITNDLLRRHGITVFELHGAELSRGRGGPRCMSMPLQRKEIK